MKNCFLLFLVILFAEPLVSMAAVRNYLGQDHFELMPGQKVTVDIFDLDLEARGADIPKLRSTTDIKISGVGATKADEWLAAHTPEFELKDGGLSIRLTPKKAGFLGLGMLTQRRRLFLVIPQTAIPDLTSSSASIALSGDFQAADPLRLRSGSGKISFIGNAPSIEIRSTSGDASLRVFRALQKLWTQSASGGITLEGGAHELHVETASGKVHVRGLLSSASVDTVSGGIDLQWDALDPQAKIKIRSSTGLIRIVFPPEASPAGSLTTSTGKIRSEFSGKISEDGNTLELDGQGPNIEIETASGDILLLRDDGGTKTEESGG